MRFELSGTTALTAVLACRRARLVWSNIASDVEPRWREVPYTSARERYAGCKVDIYVRWGPATLGIAAVLRISFLPTGVASGCVDVV